MIVGLPSEMADGRQIGLVIAAVGVLVVVLGIVVWAGGLSWFGRLPGDLRIERDGVRLFVPVTSMLLVSVVLSVVLALVRRLG